MSKAMSLKAKIRNIAKKKNIPAQVILQNYMFERLLVRLSASAYKEKFVLKGGMLVAAIVGLDNRATMDLDTTLKNLPLTPDAIRSALEQVCAISLDDGVVFEIGTISPIREDDIYGGYRVMLNARFDTLLTPMRATTLNFFGTLSGSYELRFRLRQSRCLDSHCPAPAGFPRCYGSR